MCRFVGDVDQDRPRQLLRHGLRGPQSRAGGMPVAALALFDRVSTSFRGVPLLTAEYKTRLQVVRWTAHACYVRQ